jgi:CheY-like chemotaxis protein
MLLQGKRVFVVEDNVLNRVVVKIILIKHGAQVEFERAGKETLQRLQQFGPVDLIIMDLMLTEGISGYELCEQVHELPGYEMTPIVAVSATDPAMGIPRTRAKGFAGFIAKPIDDVLFPKQLVQIMEGQQVWTAGLLHIR